MWSLILRWWWMITTYWVVDYHEGRCIASETLYTRWGTLYAQRTWKSTGLINSIQIKKRLWTNPGGLKHIQSDGRLYEYLFPHNSYMSELSNNFEYILQLRPIW